MIKSRRMGRAVQVPRMGRVELGKLEGKRPLGRPRLR